MPWLLPPLALTAAHIGGVLLGWSSPLALLVLVAMVVAWVVFAYKALATAGASGGPGQEALLTEEQKLMGELREFVGREVDGARGEIERTRGLVRAAVADLNRSFGEMEGESRVQSTTITGMVEHEGGSDSGSPGMRQFTTASGMLMEELTGALADSSRQSVVTVGKIDEMAGHLDAIFELLGGLRDIAGQAAAPALAALDDKMRQRVTSARQVVGGVRAMVEQTAEKEMDTSVEAKIKADALRDQVERIQRSLADGIRAVSASGKRIHDSVGNAVRSLQFEDIATQALTAANVHLERLQAINHDAIQLQNVLTQANATPETRIQAMEEFLRHIKEVRETWIKPAHKPVAQVDLKSGTVELF
jgi:methyl-accepting chemotaxis protein